MGELSRDKILLILGSAVTGFAPDIKDVYRSPEEIERIREITEDIFRAVMSSPVQLDYDC